LNKYVQQDKQEAFLKQGNIDTVETILAENFNAVVSYIKSAPK
jgi:hypothetical protein